MERGIFGVKELTGRPEVIIYYFLRVIFIKEAVI